MLAQPIISVNASSELANDFTPISLASYISILYNFRFMEVNPC